MPSEPRTQCSGVSCLKRLFDLARVAKRPASNRYPMAILGKGYAQFS